MKKFSLWLLGIYVLFVLVCAVAPIYLSFPEAKLLLFPIIPLALFAGIVHCVHKPDSKVMYVITRPMSYTEQYDTIYNKFFADAVIECAKAKSGCPDDEDE